MGQKAVFDFLDGLQKKHIQVLTEYFGEEVYISKLNPKLVEHYNFTLDNHQDLCQFTEFKEFSLTKTKDGYGVTFWR